MYQLSKEQVKMFVRVLMPMLYSMNDVAGMCDELDSGKPPEQQHQRGHRPDSPRIARLKARAAMAEAMSLHPQKQKAVNPEGRWNMQVIKTGIKSVDDLYGIDFTGNVIPHSWFEAIQTENGRPDLAAIVILAEILYWHRPTVERTADDAAVVVLKKKFHADLLQMSYSQIETKLCLSKDQSRRALEKLESLGLIKRRFRTVVTESGNKLGNVMYIELFTQRLIEITFPDADPCKKYPTRVSTETDKVIGKNRQAYLSEPMTNTQITTEITNTDYTSFYQQERSKVRDQVEYEYLILDRKSDRGMIDNLIDLITDVNMSGKQFQKINGEPMPTDIVRERLSRVDREVMESVIDKIKLATKPVTNLRAYLLTTLFNEPVIYETGIEMQVTQDMYRREVEAWQS